MIDFVINIIVEVVFALGIFIIQWAVRHKNISLTILAVMLMVADVLVWRYLLTVR